MLKEITMKYFLFTVICAVGFMFMSCEKFLDKNPSEGGISKFSHVDQYDALLNNFRITRNRVEWSNAIMASDDFSLDPSYQINVGINSIQLVQQWEGYSSWNRNQYTTHLGASSSFVPFQSTYSSMYDFNFIINTVDQSDIAGSATVKTQVKGEAKFWRAFYHFLLAVEYCMHPSLQGGTTPGIGYRNSITPSNTGVESRNTVVYTFEQIVKDLEEAEQDLIAVGKVELNTLEPWRISATAVRAQLARTHLYLGNYEKAFTYARLAYDDYHFLYDMNDQSKFSLKNLAPVQTEVYNGSTYSVTPQYVAITDDNSPENPNSHSNFYYKEAYFRFVSQVGTIAKMPPSKELYDSYESQDLRKKIYLDNNLGINNTSWLPSRFKDQLMAKSYSKNAANRTSMGYILGVTVPEIILIMAECRARGFGSQEDASYLLQLLRSKRFPAGYTDQVAGSIQEVKAERRRELAMVFRWFDLKRYNALDDANIVIQKKARLDPYQVSSAVKTVKLLPNAEAYALPIFQTELELLKWPQNGPSGVQYE